MNAMTKGITKTKQKKINADNPLKVVYFPSWINQVMGPAKGDPDQRPLHEVMTALLKKAGYEVIFPENMGSLCCGTIWESKGFQEQADQKSAELEQALVKASNDGAYPVLCDQSPCLYRMRNTINQLKLYEPVEFIDTFLMDRLAFTKLKETVAVHATCTTIKMGNRDLIAKLAAACAENVIIPDEVGCCGFAGDRGFSFPEVNAYALRKLRPAIQKSGVTAGYSNSRTCEIGLTTNSGVPYSSIVYLVDKCTNVLSVQKKFSNPSSEK
jgi:D-lactate dehydrogenase